MSAPAHSALFRDDRGGLQLRGFPTGEAARLAAQASGREWSEPRAVAVPHPAGGYTHARPARYGTIRLFEGNWPTRRAAERALG